MTDNAYVPENAVSPEVAIALLSIIQRIGMPEPKDGDNVEELVMRMHYRIDDLIREHAQEIKAHRILELMCLHDDLMRLVP